jgi:hypothetical protein
VLAAESQASGSGRHFVIFGLALIATRLLVILVPLPVTDIGTYGRYAREYEAASQQGEGFYEYHTRAVERQIQTAQAEGKLRGSMEEYKDVEYPPLAVAFMRVPALFLGRSADALPAEVFNREYRVAYRWGMALVDGLVLVLIGWLVIRLFPRETPGGHGLRLLFYLASTAALWHLLYDRLDLVQSLLVLLALCLLVSRLHYALSFAVLALAINFKLVPLVLAPVWLVGSLPAGPQLGPWQARAVGRLVARGTLLTAMVLAIFLPFYVGGGRESLAFLRYHGARGLEIESLWSCVPLALLPLGHAVHVDYSYGSVNVSSSLTPMLGLLAMPVTAILLGGATALLLVRMRRRMAERQYDGSAGQRLAQVFPADFACYTLLFLALFICANKVFSPQYLLWLAPLAVLVPLEGSPRRTFLLAFLLICVLSTFLMPFLFVIDLVDQSAPGILPVVVRDPTPRVVVILMVRDLLFLGWTAGLTAFLARRAFRPAASTGSSVAGV